jgi:fructose-bisphosphate aldolase, class I
VARGARNRDLRPSEYAIWTNAHALARYAALSQEAGLVPIVEPEVLMQGDHAIETSFDITSRTLDAVFRELRNQRISLQGVLLKPNMVLAGYACGEQPSDERIAELTLSCLRAHVPAAVPGVVFLSSGQSEKDATSRLNALNARGPQPWALSFSYGRALQASALAAWKGEHANVNAAQSAFAHRARLNAAARSGSYEPEMEAVGQAQLCAATLAP